MNRLWRTEQLKTLLTELCGAARYHRLCGDQRDMTVVVAARTRAG